MVKKFDIVSFGSAVEDAFVKTRFSEEKGHIIINHGCKMLIDNLFFEIGGGGTNTSVAFSRLGLKTGYVGKFGNDSVGDRISDLLKKEGIEFLGKRMGETSGFSVVLMTKEHHRSILTYKGINNDVGIKDVKNFDTKWIYLSSLLGKSLKTQMHLIKKLKKRGTKIAFNPSEYLIRKVNLKSFLKLVDVVILNKEESSLLTKKKNKLKAIYDFGPRIVVITDGSNKVEAFDGKDVFSIVPPKVKVVDKTGAGDAFASGFVAGMVVGKSIEECLNLGVKESASVVKYLGAKGKLLKMNLKKQ